MYFGICPDSDVNTLALLSIESIGDRQTTWLREIPIPRNQISGPAPGPVQGPAPGPKYSSSTMSDGAVAAEACDAAADEAAPAGWRCANPECRAATASKRRPLSTRLHEFGFQGLHTLGQNSGQNVSWGPSLLAHRSVGEPLFFCPPPFLCRSFPSQ